MHNVRVIRNDNLLLDESSYVNVIFFSGIGQVKHLKSQLDVKVKSFLVVIANAAINTFRAWKRR